MSSSSTLQTNRSLKNIENVLFFGIITQVNFAEVAQLVEHSPEEGRVGGSRPPLGTIYRILKRGKLISPHFKFGGAVFI